MAAKAEKAGASEAKKKPPLPMIIGAVVLVVVLFMGKSVLGGKKADGDGDGKKEKKKHSKVVVGEYVPLDPEFTVNLAGSGDHYLKATIALGLTKEFTEEQLKHHTAPIRDAIVTILSAKEIKDLSTPKSREALKEQIKDRLNEITDDNVVEVCFTAFATQ